MKNKLLLLLVAFFSMNSCSYQVIMDDCSCDDVAKIPINIDWSISGVVPQNVSVLVYDKASGSLVTEHRYEDNDNAIQSYIYLGEGTYTVVIFNEKRDQIDYLKVRGYESLSTLEFYVSTNTKAKARSESDNYLQEPGHMAVKIIDDVEITHELVEYSQNDPDLSAVAMASESKTQTRVSFESLMNVIPVRKTIELSVTAHIKGLNYAMMPALVDLTNVADSYFVESDMNGLNPGVVQFNMNNRTYDTGSTTEGTIYGSTVILGALGDRVSTLSNTSLQTPIQLDMLFMLLNEELETRIVDVTQTLNYTIDEYGNIEMDLYINVDEALPVVESTGSGTDSGFATDLGDWSIIDVPLTNR
ncbi:MAG: DUF5119 domain-containing protein [Rikenellaceae bacterium]